VCPNNDVEQDLEGMKHAIIVNLRGRKPHFALIGNGKARRILLIWRLGWGFGVLVVGYSSPKRS